MRRRGIVLELATDYAVVLSSDGEFCRLPRTEAMSVGAEVTWESRRGDGAAAQQPVRTWHLRPLAWKRVAAVGIAACLTIAAGAWWGQNRVGTMTAEAYAFVSIDINPSVALQVDQRQRVMDVSGLNDDGKQLLQRAHVQKDEPLQSALEEIMNAAVAAGMLPDEDAILISAAPASDKDNVSDIEEQAAQSVEHIIESNPVVKQHHPTVYSIGVSTMVWNAAERANISPGKFAAFLIAEKEGKAVGLDDLHGQTLKEILSTPSASSIVEILKRSDPGKVEQLVQGLHRQASVTKPATNKPNESGAGKTESKSPGKGHGSGTTADGQPTGVESKGHQAHNSSGNAHEKARDSGEVTVQLGNSVITVPIGPLVNSYASNGKPGDKSKKRDNTGDGQNSDSWRLHNNSDDKKNEKNRSQGKQDKHSAQENTASDQGRVERKHGKQDEGQHGWWSDGRHGEGD
jgi:hypothetical protein